MHYPDNSFILENVILFNQHVSILVVDGLIEICVPKEEMAVPAEFNNLPRHDGQGALVFPSFIDAHVHLREPGFEYKEDIQTGLAAAAYGGFGAVFAMANTKPINDKATVTRYMIEKALQHWPHGPTLHPIGALTVGLEGKELAPIGELADAGCVAISNDGRPVGSTEIFRRGIEYSAQWGLKVIDHCEDPTLAPGYVMNESHISGSIGVKGQPVVGESMQVARDILLAEYLNMPIHLAHISCKQSVDLIAWGKERGVPVTAETCPHYLILDDSYLTSYNAQYKVSPPLRTKEDVEAMNEAVASGVIDILVTDHAPHAAHEKEETLDNAPCGFIGLELAVALTYPLVKEGKLSAKAFADRWHYTPASIFSLAPNNFEKGDVADFFLFDPNKEWTASRETLHSKSINTPFLGQTMTGKVVAHWQKGMNVLQTTEEP